MRLIEPFLPDSVVTPVLCCGMVGAKQGWSEAGYGAVPCTPMGAASPGARARPTPELPSRSCRTVPGRPRPTSCVARKPDCRLSGRKPALRRGDLPARHPQQLGADQRCRGGEFSHNHDRRIVCADFAAIGLRHSVGAEGWDAPAFDRSVAATLSRPAELLARLFRLRAADILHGERGAPARAALSGLLIGAELAATRPTGLGRMW